MKNFKLSAFGLLAAAALALAACNKSEPEPKPMPEPEPDVTLFEIDVTDITGGSATVTVTPHDRTGYYYFDVVSDLELRRYGSAEKALNAVLNDVAGLVEKGKYTWNDILSKGKDQFTFHSTFEPETDYTVISAYVNLGSTVTLDPTAKPATQKFSTTEVGTSRNTFYISESSGNITVIPSLDDEYYLWSFGETEWYDGLSDEEVISEELSRLHDAGIDLSSLLACGQDSYDYGPSCKEGVSYTVLAFGYDGGVTTGLTRYDFIYGKKNNNNISDLSLSLYYDGLYLCAYASNSDPYVLEIFTDHLDARNYPDSELQSQLLGNADREEKRTGTGRWGFPGSGKFTVFAFGYDDGKITTDINRLLITSGEAAGASGYPAGCKFDVKITKLSSSSATVKVTPSDLHTLYYYDFGFMSELNSSFGGDKKRYFQEYLDFVGDYIGLFNAPWCSVLDMGPVTFSKTGLSPGDKMIAMAGAVVDGKLVGDVGYFEFQTTRAEVSGMGVSDNPDISDVSGLSAEGLLRRFSSAASMPESIDTVVRTYDAGLTRSVRGIISASAEEAVPAASARISAMSSSARI